MRGVTEDGKALNIAGDYIAHGIRYRGSEILTRELGLQSEREVEQQLDLEVDQDRLTRLDRNLIAQAGDEKQIDMRQNADPEGFGDAQRYRLLRRLKKLERMGLAEESETGRWSLSSNTEKTLRAMGERGDIIKTMHRTLAERGIERGMDRYVIHHGPERDETMAIGRVIGKGLSADEMSDRIHVVVDGIDGRVHYAEMAEAQAEGVKIGSASWRSDRPSPNPGKQTARSQNSPTMAVGAFTIHRSSLLSPATWSMFRAAIPRTMCAPILAG